jgi:hypothetical protein
VDGVLSRNPFVANFDAFWYNRGDLVRTQNLLPASAVFPEVDRVQIILALSNNILTVPATLKASMNGVLIGNITVNPGDTVKNVLFNVHFVNPTSNTRDVGANIYGTAPH